MVQKFEGGSGGGVEIVLKSRYEGMAQRGGEGGKKGTLNKDLIFVLESQRVWAQTPQDLKCFVSEPQSV